MTNKWILFGFVLNYFFSFFCPCWTPSAKANYRAPNTVTLEVFPEDNPLAYDLAKTNIRQASFSILLPEEVKVDVLYTQEKGVSLEYTQHNFPLPPLKKDFFRLLVEKCLEMVFFQGPNKLFQGLTLKEVKDGIYFFEGNQKVLATVDPQTQLISQLSYTFLENQDDIKIERSPSSFQGRYAISRYSHIKKRGSEVSITTLTPFYENINKLPFPTKIVLESSVLFSPESQKSQRSQRSQILFTNISVQ